jgi:hypothetical protein
MPMTFASKSRGPHRTVSDTWQRLAGELAVVADMAAQGAAAARRHDAKALSAITDHLRLAMLGAISLHNKSRESLEKEPRS